VAGASVARMRGTSLDRLRVAWTRTAQRERLTAALGPILSEIRGTVLDVGGGRTAPHDTSWRDDVRRIRLDLSPVHRPDAIADAGRLPVRDGGADAVVLIELLEHVPVPQAVIDEARRTLRRGGILVVSAPFIAPLHGDPGDYFRFSAFGLRHLVRAFEDVRVIGFGNHWSASWALVSARSRSLRVANPVFRRLGRRTDPRTPQGHVVIARR
jgi:SAM-dependent methyltransferase